MGVFRQIYCAVIVGCLCLNLGLILAWPSSTISLFSSVNTTLDRPMTEMEITLLGSLSSIAAVIGTPLTGVLLDLLGRKYCCILFSLAPVVSWSILSFARRVELVLLSVFVSGLVGTSFMIVPNFINEFSQESIRGTLTATVNIFFGLGIIVSYFLGGFWSYDVLNYVYLTIFTVTIILLALVRESPVHLMKKGLEKEAVESICFYRSEKPNSKIVLQEIDNLRRNLNPQFGDTQPEGEALKPESAKKLTKWQFIRKHKPTVRGFFISFTLLNLAVFQGLIIVQVYAQVLLQDTLPSISATWTTMAFGFVNVISAVVAAYLIDVFGRRPVMIYSSLFTCVFCILLGSHLQLLWAPSWLAAALIFLYCATVTSGANVVPFVVVAEMFLPEVRGVMTMLIIESGWIFNFLILVIFNPLLAAVGMGIGTPRGTVPPRYSFDLLLNSREGTVGGLFVSMCVVRGWLVASAGLRSGWSLREGWGHW
ncbi:unnamed protein product [Danaus chrysippus]|uniref:(African queen) hypothetical protein n=1 Tax=Danaus chrysippus TaxID=151541 RepID=A0A8J2QIB3_9NEOP|nr:unnamed protein product [Danaus chrysippus]